MTCISEFNSAASGAVAALENDGYVWRAVDQQNGTATQVKDLPADRPGLKSGTGTQAKDLQAGRAGKAERPHKRRIFRSGGRAGKAQQPLKRKIFWSCKCHWEGQHNNR